MTIAVLFATTVSADGVSAALSLGAETVLDRLRRQLATLGACRQIAVTRPGNGEALRAAAAEPLEIVESATVADDLRVVGRLARLADEPLVIAHTDLAAHYQALAALLADPKATTGGLVTGRDYYRALRGVPRVRVERGYVVSAETGYHMASRPNATFLGLLRVGPENRETLATAADDLAAVAEKPADTGSGRPRDVPALLLVALVRSGVQVTPRYLRGLHCLRATDREAAAVADEELREVDEDRVLLDAAVKGSDGFFTTHFVSPYSKYLARWAARRGFTPNAVTGFSMALGVVAAACFATGVRPGLVAGAVVLQAAFTFDCVDGQLARYTRTFSLLGAWLDSVFDRAKEYVVYAGLAVGAVAAAPGGDAGGVWALAVAAVILQSLRHLIDFSYGARRRYVVPSLPHRPLDDPGDGFPPPAVMAVVTGNPDTGNPATEAAVTAAPEPAARRALLRVKRIVAAAGRESERIPALYWFKRMIVLPIGERFALISVTAAFYDARVTFTALLIWGTVAACYVLATRVLRSLS